MSDKNEQKSGAEPPADDGSERPRPTIELNADEVTEVTEKPSDGESGDANPDDAKPGDADAPEKAAQQSEAEAAARTRRRQPPQRTQPSEVRGFVTHLAAGLMGGVAGVIGAGVGLDRLPFFNAPPAAVSADGGRLAELSTRLETLEQRPVASAPDMSAVENRLAGIDERLAAQVKSASQGDATLAAGQSEQAERISRLDSALKALGDVARQGGGEAVAPAAAVALQVNDLTARIETRIDALEKKAAAAPAPDAALETRLGKIEVTLDGLEQRLTSAAQTGGADPAVITTLDQRLTAAEKRMESFADTARSASEAKSDAALAVALPALRRSVESGRPYEAELEALAALSPPGADLTPLRASASKGVATIEQLKDALPAAIRKAEDAAEPEPQTLMDQVLAGARDIVKVRRTGGGDTQAAMRASLDKGDVSAAIAAAGQLPAPSRAAMQDWIGRAEARRKAVESLAALEKLAAGVPAPASN